MHLFITDFFISVDMLAPIISLLKKNKLKVGILNQNIIQDFKNEGILNYLINKEKVTYFDFLPVTILNKLRYHLIRSLLFLPRFCLMKMIPLWYFVTRKLNFFSKKKFYNFLIKNNIKSITISENFQYNNAVRIKEVAKTLGIPMILIPSGLRLDEVAQPSKRINICDHYLNPNNALKSYRGKRNISKNLIMGSPRYHSEWLKNLKKIYKKNPNLKKFKKNIVKVATFIKTGSHFGENDDFLNLIKKLKKDKNIDVKVRNKPSDILPNKCTKYLNDGFSSSELIDWCDVVLVARPSSVLVEAVIKDKHVYMVNYNNSIIKKCNFYNFKIINKSYNENNIIKKISLLESDKKNRDKKNRDKKNKELFLKKFINYKSSTNNSNNNYIKFYQNF